MLARKGATVHVLDVSEPDPTEPVEDIQFHSCDVSSWEDLRAAFAAVGRVDFAFANAAVTEQRDYFSDVFDEDGQLCEPDASFHRVLDVNLKAVVYFVKIARSMMRRHGTHGSIVITTSATAYAPEQSLPVYAAAKTGVGYPLSLIRFPTIAGSYWLS